jgi:hypothetical protein
MRARNDAEAVAYWADLAHEALARGDLARARFLQARVHWCIAKAERAQRRAAEYPTARELALAFRGRRLASGGWICRCPAHEDRSPSLSVIDGKNGRPVLHCFAGCSFQDIVHGLQSAGQWPC